MKTLREIVPLNEMKRGWHIKGPKDDGEQLYWSNKHGWADQDSATRFSKRQMKRSRLPFYSNAENPENTPGEWESPSKRRKK